MSSEAFFTLIYNDAYLPGALVLAKALRETNTTKQLAVLIGPEVSSQAKIRLGQVFDHVIPTQTISITQADAPQFKLLGRPNLDRTYTKVNLWLQTQFSKVVFLDADTLPLKNIDSLFDTIGSDKKPAIAACPDIGWPDIFNSGVLVTSPNKQTFETLAGRARAGLSFDGGDQGLLNQFFENNWKRLPFIYNVTPSASYQYTPAYQHYRDQVAIIHFIGEEKPWSYSLSGPFNDSSEFQQRWWSIFNKYYDSNLNLKSDTQTSYTTSSHEEGEDNNNDNDDLASNVYQEMSNKDVTNSVIPTIQPDVLRWDATKYVPPRDTRPEAENLVITQYVNAWDNSNQQHNNNQQHHHHHHHHHQHHHHDYSFHLSDAPQPPIDPVFPWEGSQPKPERIFPEDEIPSEPEVFTTEFAPSQQEEQQPHHEEPQKYTPPVVEKKEEEPIRVPGVTREFRDYSQPPDNSTALTGRTWNAWDNDSSIERYIQKNIYGASRKLKKLDIRDNEETDEFEAEEDPEKEQYVEEGIEEADDELKKSRLIHSQIKRQNSDGILLKDKVEESYKTPSFKSRKQKVDTVTEKRNKNKAPIYLPITPNPITLREEGIHGGLSDASEDEGEGDEETNKEESAMDKATRKNTNANISGSTFAQEMNKKSSKNHRLTGNFSNHNEQGEEEEVWDPHQKLEELAQMASLLAAKQAELEKMYEDYKSHVSSPSSSSSSTKSKLSPKNSTKSIKK